MGQYRLVLSLRRCRIVITKENPMRNYLAILSLAAVAALASGCSTWDNLSRAEKGAVIGVGAGAVVGSQLGDGSTLNTLGGAAVGGVIGHEVGRRTN